MKNTFVDMNIFTFRCWCDILCIQAEIRSEEEGLVFERNVMNI